MNCHQLETSLIEYVDGKLAAASRSTVEDHLRSCAGCRARVEGFRSVSQVLDGWDAPETSPWFTARLRQRIAALEAASWGWRTWRAWAEQLRFLLAPGYATAMGFMIVAGSLAVWNTRPAPAPRAPVVAQHRTEEITPAVDDYEILADFDVLSDLEKKESKL